MNITKDMTIGEVIKKYPNTAEVFVKNHLMCFGCGMAQMETVEQGCMSHGIDVDKFVKDLNEASEKEGEE